MQLDKKYQTFLTGGNFYEYCSIHKKNEDLTCATCKAIDQVIEARDRLLAAQARLVNYRETGKLITL